MKPIGFHYVRTKRMIKALKIIKYYQSLSEHNNYT